MSDQPRPLSLGERIKLQRERKGWSQRELATRARVNYSLISRLESGDVVDTFTSRMRRIARALGVSIDYLVNTFNGEPDDSPKLSPEAASAVESEALPQVATLIAESS